MPRIVTKALLQKLQYIEWLSTMPDLSRADLAVAIKIVSAYNNRRGFAWPSLPTIAADVGCSKRQVISSIQRLEQDELILVKRSIGRGHANEYIPRFDLIPVNGPYQHGKGEARFTLSDSALNGEKVKSSAEKVKSSVTKGEAQFTPTDLVTDLLINRSVPTASINIDALFLEDQKGQAKDEAKRLAQIEKAAKQNRLTAQQCQDALDYLEDIQAARQNGDPLHGWAMRVSDLIYMQGDDDHQEH
jgi:hypothetical protein